MKKKGNRANTSNRTNEPKFTRGPWQAEEDGLIDKMVVGGNYDLIIDLTHKDGKRNEADSNLIAAAPDMYNNNETTLQEITEIFSGLNAACGKCMRYLEIGNKACRTCAAHKALKIAEQMKNRISKLQQKARGEQEE